jgi:hypothetical protein
MEIPIPVLVIWGVLFITLTTFCVLMGYVHRETRKTLLEAQEGWRRALANWRTAAGLHDTPKEKWPEEIEQ